MSDRSLPVVSPTAYRRITWFALASLALIIVTGASVRLTGSGLGCSDWPTCEEGKLVAPLEFHAMVEFVNRLVTGLVSIAVIAAVASSMLRDPRRADLTRWSWGLVAGVVAQVILGGITVLTELNPWIVSGHFLISLVLIWNAVVLWHFAGFERTPHDRAERTPTARWATVVAAWGALAFLTGPMVTGAGPHAGDEDAPRFDVAITTVARIHSIAMWIFVAGIVALALVARRDRSELVTQRTGTLLFVAVLQGALGYFQYWADVPAGLVGLHVAGATVVWGLTIWVALGARWETAVTR